jgi:hypothetical protein
MRPSTIAKTLTIAAVTALALGIAPRAKADDRGCSEATLKGTFAYTSTGYIVAAAPMGVRMPRWVHKLSTGKAVLPSLSMRARTAP